MAVPAEFERIYTDHFQNVYRYVFSLCREDALAEEITQETFYRAMEHLDRFDGKCRLYVWLCQIAKNIYFTYRKRQSRQVPMPEDLAQPGPGLEDRLEDRDMAWQLHQRLHRLEEPYKEVFSLRVFGELPYAQIGALFGKSDSWARLIFYRAKKELRRGLMKLPCNTVQDLLPLYLEDACALETRAMIDEHLITCDACARELKLLSGAAPTSLPHPDQAKMATATDKIIQRNHGQAVLGVFRNILVGLLLCQVLMEHFGDMLFVGGFYNGNLTVSTLPLALVVFGLEELYNNQKTGLDWVWIVWNFLAAVHIQYALNIHHGLLGCLGQGTYPIECGLNVAWRYAIPWLVLLLLRQWKLPKDMKRTWSISCICLTLVMILIFTAVACIRSENFSLGYFQKPTLTWATYGFLFWQAGNLFNLLKWVAHQAKETIQGQE